MLSQVIHSSLFATFALSCLNSLHLDIILTPSECLNLLSSKNVDGTPFFGQKSD